MAKPQATNKKLLFVAEGLGARVLRLIHHRLLEHFVSVKVVERVMDTAFSNMADYDIAIFWQPRNREKAESFVRNVQMRSRSLPVVILSENEDLCGLQNYSTEQHVSFCKFPLTKDLDEIASYISQFNVYAAIEGGLSLPNTSHYVAPAQIIKPLDDPHESFSGRMKKLEDALKKKEVFEPSVLLSFQQLEQTMGQIEKTILNIKDLQD